MDKRKRRKRILINLIDEYIENCEPISSRLINEKYVTDVSPATIRIDLSELEKNNLIYQPHTSAGRIPTIKGYRKYLIELSSDFLNESYEKTDLLREILIQNYKNTPISLHYIMRLLAKETDQLSFLAEPEISYGFLKVLEAFKISSHKLLFVISLDSGLDKTVIVNCDYEISNHQVKAIVRYVNEKIIGLKIYDIQNKILDELLEEQSAENKLIKLFLEELRDALMEINSYFIHFDGSTKFFNQPEFEKRESIIKFLNFTQRQDHLINLMQERDSDKTFVILGEELGRPGLRDYAMVCSKYKIFDVPGYLGVLGPIRMNYRKNFRIINNIAKVITNTTKKGAMVVNHGK